MIYRDLYSHDPHDLILCDNCYEEFRWFVLEDRPRLTGDWMMGTIAFRLPCGHVVELFDDVIPLRGQLA